MGTANTAQLKMSFKLIALLGVLLVSVLQAKVQAQDHVQTQAHVHPQHPSAMGIHGMALFVHDGQLYASHMPLANSIHAHQVIFTIELAEQDEALVQDLAAQHSLLSLMPQAFDLFSLMEGGLQEFKADLYTGHFEREGKVARADILVKVAHRLLVDDLKEGDNGHFYVLATSAHSALLVHKISTLPSFDQILEVQFKTLPDGLVAQGSPALLSLSKGQPLLPAQVPEHGLFSAAMNIKQLYLEQQDFR